jgi:hypothetical protein
MSEIKTIIFRYFYYLYNRGTLRYLVKVCITSVTEPSNQVLLPSVILNYEDVFENNIQKIIACIAETSYAINLRPSTILLFQPLRNLLATKLEALRHYLIIAEANGWIRHSISEAGTPIVFAQKKDGSMRLCVDYCGLNDIIIKDYTPLPLIAETLDRLSSAQVFSALNLKDAYYRIPIKCGDK